MPGLLRGIARVAAVAGTATAVSNRVSRRQAGRWAQQDQPPEQDTAPPPPAAAAPSPSTPADPLAQLKELAELKNEGVLTDAEFADQKHRILSAAT